MTERSRHPKIELWKALHAFQAESVALQRDKINPAFKSKYLSLDALHEQVMPLLSKHGLVWITAPNFEAHGGEIEPNLSYRLIHAESGHETSGRLPLILGKRDMQGLGSAVTYARRYALMSVLGLVADEDDDGNAASRSRGSDTPVRGQMNGSRSASEKQQKLIRAKAADKGLDASALANAMLAAAGTDPRTFDDDAAAVAFVDRNLSKLPGSKVDAVLAAIELADEAVPF